eukprot:scaffold9783_cov127-Isochrysis_galbana.AAC.10
MPDLLPRFHSVPRNPNHDAQAAVEQRQPSGANQQPGRRTQRRSVAVEEADAREDAAAREGLATIESAQRTHQVLEPRQPQLVRRERRRFHFLEPMPLEHCLRYGQLVHARLGPQVGRRDEMAQ